MIDQRLYRETFSRLCASEEAKKEVFQMLNEKNKTRRLPGILRAGTIAAAMALALAVTAGAADLATGGALLRSLRQVWTDGYETRYEAVDEEGNEILLSVSAGARIETRDGGRTMVLCAAGEEVDITQRLAEDGQYHFAKETERRSVEVDVTGSAESWEMTETITDSDGVVYTNRVTSDDMANNSVICVSEKDADPLIETETKVSVSSGLFTVESASSASVSDGD